MSKAKTIKKATKEKPKIITRNRKSISKIHKKQTIKMKLAKPQIRQVIKQKLKRNRFNKKCERTQNNQAIQTHNLQKQNILPEEQRYQCPICLQLMIYPTLAPCGHAFCLPCFEQILKYQKDCSICRQTMSFYEFKPSKLLMQIISVFKGKLQVKEEEESYAQRVNDFHAKEQLRNISKTLEVGDSIDYCKDWRWYEGKIADIVVNSSNETTLKVHSILNSSQILDYKMNSRLIAKHKHFTSQNTLNNQWSPRIRYELFDFDFLSYEDNQPEEMRRLLNRPTETITINDQDYFANFDMSQFLFPRLS